jgi:hypothetical protein
MARPLSAYLKQIWFDTLVYTPAAVRRLAGSPTRSGRIALLPAPIILLTWAIAMSERLSTQSQA